MCVCVCVQHTAHVHIDSTYLIMHVSHACICTNTHTHLWCNYTITGKKIKALMDKQVEDIKEADDVDDVSAGGSEEEEEDHVDVPPPPKSNTPTPAADTIKMEVDEELATKADQKGLGTKGQKNLGTREGK